MNQSLQFDLSAPIAAVTAAGLFSSLCTVKQATNVPNAETGQVDLTDAGFTNIITDVPCMRAPFNPVRIMADSKATPTMSEEFNPFHLLLNGYYPQVPEALNSPAQLLVIIDGVQHDILGVESDSQKQMTRLHVTQVSV